MYRLLKAKLDAQSTHITTKNLITTLINMNVTNIYDVEYIALYTGNKTLDALTQLTPFGLDRLIEREKIKLLRQGLHTTFLL